MNKLPRGFIYLCRLCLLAALVFVVYMSIRPDANMPQITNIDKAYHIVAYMGLGVLALLSAFSRQLLWPALMVIGFGAGIEILQGTTAIGRTASLADILANSAGVALAATAYVILVKPTPIDSA